MHFFTSKNSTFTVPSNSPASEGASRNRRALRMGPMEPGALRVGGDNQPMGTSLYIYVTWKTHWKNKQKM